MECPKRSVPAGFNALYAVLAIFNLVQYDQTQHEWVMLLKGEATLEFEQGEPVTLTPGDYLTIPPHQKHRVASTSISSETLWLAVFYD